MAPLMVPVGILQIGGWGLLVLGGFVLNALVTFGLEVVNLAYYGVMSLFNLVGSFLSGAADLVGASLVGSLGVCPNGIADPACAYQSLHYHFGVSILRAPPLIDPRLLFPTHFNNNALLSVALDLMGHLDPVVVASFIGLAALGIPLFLMTGSSIGLRVLVGLLVGLLGIPAVMTQAGLMGNVFDLQQLNDAGQIVVTHRSFYAYAADLFRTGVGNVFTRPAMALAQQALDAVLHAQDGLASFSGGPAA
jgi:hypothetical protein